MRAFRFRAQAALDLRRREDDTAKRAYAQAERDLREAAVALYEADGRLAAARGMLTEAMGAPGQAGEGEWYRFWILRLEQERQTSAGLVAACEKTRAARGAECLRTRQRVESLERFRGKASDAHARAEEAETRKELDALGTMRFVARQRA